MAYSSEEHSGSQSDDVLENSSSVAKEKSGKSEVRLGGRKGKKKSKCWLHFQEYRTKDGGRRAKHCGDSYACGLGSNGTINLNKHITSRCKKYRSPNNDPRQTFRSKQPNLEGSSSTLATSRYNAEECRHALVEMLILDELPLRFVENQGFRKFFFAMNPRFDVPSRRTIVRDLYQLYVEERIKLKNYFKSSQVRVCLTRDTWTSIQNINYMVVTSHFIDCDWKLQKRILSFSQITDHKGDSIGRCIEKVLLDWGIDKIFTITVDNTTANANAIGYMIRKLNSWHVGGAILEDVPTQWNSTYLMLESAVKLRKAFERMEEENGHYINYFGESDNEKKRIGPPLLNDWENAKVFIHFLSTFYDITLDFSVSLHVTSNIYFKSWCTIFNQLTSLSTERDPLVSRMAMSMKLKFDKYWKSLDQTNNLLIIAVVLDPMYKLAYVKWRFDAFFGVQQSQLMISSLREVLVELYDCYIKLYGCVGVMSNDGVSTFESGVDETFSEKEKFREDSLWGQKQQE
ncbi:hypothetical protein Ddye_013021 [Dipteronia dyeriana]|uniref:hAT-like transposase RNase-H fold domain-containing protein n=1 Tax=Dipteronia dyeriana TaxID=168575 RepID=A0AAD9X5I5_9ROSI|nr:hypothetical protein Ddye_013021 [Dipteronia dyeriana]